MSSIFENQSYLLHIFLSIFLSSKYVHFVSVASVILVISRNAVAAFTMGCCLGYLYDIQIDKNRCWCLHFRHMDRHFATVSKLPQHLSTSFVHSRKVISFLLARVW